MSRVRCVVSRVAPAVGLTDDEQPYKIDWKDDSKNLTKLYPRVSNEPDDVSEGGSFFNFFECAEDPFDVSASVI
jgi:hypothetical protein